MFEVSFVLISRQASDALNTMSETAVWSNRKFVLKFLWCEASARHHRSNEWLLNPFWLQHESGSIDQNEFKFRKYSIEYLDAMHFVFSIVFCWFTCNRITFELIECKNVQPFSRCNEIMHGIFGCISCNRSNSECTTHESSTHSISTWANICFGAVTVLSNACVQHKQIASVVSAPARRQRRQCVRI